MDKKMNELLQLKFLMFENQNNICWLDASIALIAHNKTIKKVVQNCPVSEINKLISAYEKAISAYNNSDSEQTIKKSQKMLKLIQNDALNYLKQFLKFEHGKPDSAFCALLNFIYQDKSNIKEYLNASWIWRKQCSSCGMNSKSSLWLKPIITLTKVDVFRPDCPSSTYICSCKSEQNMKLIYKELPPCLIFHFENGVKYNTNLPITFTMKGREYQLTGIIILEKSTHSKLNHFVTWIRNPHLNMWLECNDLNADFASFSRVKPEFNLKDVYITVFESFDDLHRIKNDEVSPDLEQDVENSNVELINVSDEDYDAGKADSYDDKTSIFLKSTNTEINASKERLLVDDEKEKSVVQNLGMCSNEEKESCNADSQDVSGCSLKLNHKIPLNKPEVETTASTVRNLETTASTVRNLETTASTVRNLETTASTVRNLETTASTVRNLETTASTVRNLETTPSTVRNLETTPSIVRNLETYGNEMSLKSEKENSCENLSVENSSALNKIAPEKYEKQITSHKFDCKDESISDSHKAKKGNEELSDNQEQKITDVSAYDNPKSGPSFENTSPTKKNKVEDFDHLEKETKMPNSKNVNDVEGSNCEKIKINDGAKKKMKRKKLKEEDREELNKIINTAVENTFLNFFGFIMEKKNMNEGKEKP